MPPSPEVPKPIRGIVTPVAPIVTRSPPCVPSMPRTPEYPLPGRRATSVTGLDKPRLVGDGPGADGTIPRKLASTLPSLPASRAGVKGGEAAGASPLALDAGPTRSPTGGGA